MYAPGTAPRTTLQLVSDKHFGTLFWFKFVTNMAYWAQTMVIVSLTWEVTGSAAAVGLVSAAQLGPQLLFSLLSGRAADSEGVIGQVVAGRFVCCGSALGLSIWLVVNGTGDGPADAVPLLLASVSAGIGFVIGGPALNSLPAKLVSAAELPKAAALNTVPTAVARCIGPAGGALVASVASPSVALLLVAIANAAFASTVLLMSWPTFTPKGDDPDRRISAALRHVWADRTLLTLLVGVAALGFANEPAMTLAPALADGFGGGAEGAGQIASAFGVGGLLGLLLERMSSTRFSPTTQGCAGLALCGAGIGATAVVPLFGLACAAMCLAGAGAILAFVSLGVAIQQTAPRDMLGRVMALWLIAYAGVRPIASLALGFVADHLSTDVALIVTAGLAGAVAVAVQRIKWGDIHVSSSKKSGDGRSERDLDADQPDGAK